jgi:hypothetical protein
VAVFLVCSWAAIVGTATSAATSEWFANSLTEIEADLPAIVSETVYEPMEVHSPALP